MTNQQAFDKVYKHLIKQNYKCVDIDGGCMYRFEGMKCAVGALIPDKLYKKEFENNSVDYLIDRYPELKHLFKTVNINLLLDLQCIHDRYAVCSWPSDLKEVAKKYKLEVPID